MDIKCLERITLRGFEEKDTINVVEFDNKYYCIDDPILIDNAKDYRVIAKANNSKELWQYYIDNNIHNCLDPFKLLILYKKNIITKDILPRGIRKILGDTKEIEDDILEEFEQYVRDVEKNRPILLHITILLAIKEATKKLKANKIAINIKDLVHDLTNTYSNITHMPNPKGILAYTERIVLDEEEKEEKREWVGYKERREEAIKEALAGSSANIVVKSNLDFKEGEKFEGYKPREEKFKRARLEIEFSYPKEKEKILLELIDKTKKNIANFCRKYDISIGGMN